MRRGLISWSAREVPASVLDARVGRLQAAMRAEKLDAVLAYTCFSQPASVTWLTHFVPYWNDALVVVFREGPPVMLAAFSKRVQNWIREVSHVGEVMTAPNLGRGAVGLLKERVPRLASGAGRIGIIERDDFPWTVAEPLVEAGWGNALVDATPLYAAIRQPADPAEIGLAQHAAGMAGKALDALPSNAGKASQSLAAIEASARCDGAEEVLVRIAPDLTKSAVLQRIEEDAVLGARYAVQLSLAYKGVWVRLVRCVSSGAAPVSWEAARRWLADAATRMTAANVASGPQGSAPGEVAAWSVEACLGNEPLTVIAHGGSGSARTSVSRSLPAGALGVLNVQLLTKDGPWHGSVPFVLGAQGASTKLLA